MKIRGGFVSNSSSSSFVIPIRAIKPWQIEMIKDHINVALKYIKDNNIECEEFYGDLNADSIGLGYVSPEQAWHIEERRNCIFGATTMDNFDMDMFLQKIVRIENEYVKWESDSWGDFIFDNEMIDKWNREILREKLQKLNDIGKENEEGNKEESNG